MPSAQKYAMALSPSLTQQPDKIRTYKALIDQGVSPENALSTVFDPETVQALRMQAQLMNKPLTWVFEKLHQGGNQFIFSGNLESAVDAAGNPVFIQGSRAGGASKVEGYAPPPKQLTTQQLIAQQMQEAQQRAKAANEKLAAEQKVNPAIRGMVILKDNGDGTFWIGPKGGKPAYTWTPH